MKKLVVFVSLILLFNIINANALNFSLKERGISNLVIEEPKQEKCIDLNIVAINPLKDDQNYYFIVLRANFVPVIEGEAKIIIKTNKVSIKEVPAFKGKKIIEIPKYYLRNNLNEIELCGKTSYSTPKIELSNETRIETRKSPMFINSFKVNTEEKELIEGDTIEVKIQVINEGSLASDVNINWIRKDVNIGNEIEFISGEDKLNTRIKAGEKKELSYKIKLKKAIKMNLPQAEMTYVNAFNEIEKTYSEIKKIEVKKATPEIKLFLLTKKINYKPKKEINLTVGVQNKGKNKLKNLKIKVESALDLKEKEFTIKEINAGEIKYLELKGKAISPGIYVVKCETNSKEINFKCNELRINVKRIHVSLETMLGAILLFIGIISFFVSYKKLKN